MDLPNGEHAVVAIEKLRDYCLSPDHPQGRHKARVFATALGFTASDAQRLQSVLLDAARSQQVSLGQKDAYGQRYVMDIAVVGLTEIVTIRSSWIIRSEEEFPHLVTCYIL